MTLKDELRADLTRAMKARDELSASTIRMVLTAVTNEEVAGKSARVLTDDEVLKVLTREAKKRREAEQAYLQAGRQELAAREQAELGVIETYLPQQMTDAEVTEAVAAAIVESGAEGPQGMGQVMKVLSPKIAGRADGGKVAAEVRRQLGG